MPIKYHTKLLSAKLNIEIHFWETGKRDRRRKGEKTERVRDRETEKEKN